MHRTRSVSYTHLVFERYDAALFAFILNYAAYFAEIFRGGIQAIPQGQYEAAKVLRLTRFQTVTRIILPQVVKIVLPSVGNEIDVYKRQIYVSASCSNSNVT